MTDLEALRSALKPIAELFADAEGRLTPDYGEVTGRDFQMITMHPDPVALARDLRRAAEAYAALEAAASPPILEDDAAVAYRQGIEFAAQWHEDMFRKKIGEDKKATPEQADKFMSRLLWHSWASAALRALALSVPPSPAPVEAGGSVDEALVERVSRAIEEALDKFQMIDGMMDTKDIARAAIRAALSAIPPATEGPIPSTGSKKVDAYLDEVMKK